MGGDLRVSRPKTAGCEPVNGIDTKRTNSGLATRSFAGIRPLSDDLALTGRVIRGQ